MKKAISTLLICGSALTASCANMGLMGDPLSVTESTTVNAPASEVWALVGEFNDLERWHPAVTMSKQLADQRYLTLADGAEIVEQETARDNTAMSYSYRILSGPLPVEDYQATINVSSVNANESTVTWSSTFDANGVPDAQAEEVIRGVYKAGLQHLNRMYTR